MTETPLIARLQQVAKMLACPHTNRTGGNDYQLCNDCGCMWDYRRETAGDALRRLQALLAVQDQYLGAPSAEPVTHADGSVSVDEFVHMRASQLGAIISERDALRDQLATSEQARDMYQAYSEAQRLMREQAEQARTQLQQGYERACQRWGNLRRRIKDEIIHFGEPHLPKQATAQHSNGIARLRWVLHEMAKSPDVLQEAVPNREDDSAARLAQIEALRPRMEHFLDTACSMSRAEVLFMTSRLLRDLLTLLAAPPLQPQTEPT